MSLFRRGRHEVPPDPIAAAQRLDGVFLEFAGHEGVAGLVRWLTIGPLRVGGEVEIPDAEFYTVVASIDDRAVELNLPIFGLPDVIITGRVGDRSVDLGEAWGTSDAQFADAVEMILGDRWAEAIEGTRTDDSAAEWARVAAWLGGGASDPGTLSALRVGLVELDGGRRMVVPPEFVGEAIVGSEPRLETSDVAARVSASGWHIEPRRLR
ncbi:MAG: hypothetical protein AAGC46_00555 [Solirubrobacteraceae bacterium]|nr:hypothetical protein [Patulibacter sp.]